MQSADLNRFVGSVVVLSLVSGQEVTGKITSVDGATMVISKPRMFVPSPNPRNPNELAVACLPFGYPLYEADESLRLDVAHIVTIFTPKPDMVSAYIQKTSGIVTAAPGALDQLAGLDFSKFRS
jgi:hypothetical protein